MDKQFLKWYYMQEGPYVSLDDYENKYKGDLAAFKASMAPFFDIHNKHGIHLSPRYEIGIISIKKTVAFLLMDEQDDLIVELYHLGPAMDQDLVLVEKKRRHNQVVCVISSHLTDVIATIKKTKKFIRFDSTQTRNKDIVVQNMPDYLVDGHVVVLKIDDVTENQVITHFSEVIGHKNDPDMDIVKIIYEYNWPLVFPKELIRSLQDIEVDESYEQKTRKDLTDQLVVTIDGEDAKDLDDAISLSKNKDETYTLGVHIADVSYFVKENTLLDDEAYKRATSVYLADRVIPMLPHSLSNDLCSLNPHETKYTLTCEMTLNDQADVIDYKIFASRIESKQRLTYTAVNALLKNNTSLGNKEVDDMVFKMNEFSQKLKIKRRKRGAVDFESTELKFILDLEGRVLDVVERKTDEAEQLIESFMILANETVAEHFVKKNLPGIYRVHEKPDIDKLDTALHTLEQLGFHAHDDSKSTTKILQKLTQKSRNTPYQHVVHMILLRSMQKAKYWSSPIGHFGLASTYYAHFTSPIRRYPDLLLHRMIRDLIINKDNQFIKRKKHFESRMVDDAQHTSAQERKAVNMERDVIRLKSCDYMQDKIGTVFEATIIQVMPSGMFVRIEKGIEGFVALRDVNSYLIYDEKNLVFQSDQGKRYRLGDSIVVKLIQVNMLEKQISFTIEEIGKKSRFKNENHRTKQKGNARVFHRAKNRSRH